MGRARRDGDFYFVQGLGRTIFGSRPGGAGLTIAASNPGSALSTLMVQVISAVPAPCSAVREGSSDGASCAIRTEEPNGFALC